MSDANDGIWVIRLKTDGRLVKSRKKNDAWFPFTFQSVGKLVGNRKQLNVDTGRSREWLQRRYTRASFINFY